jgi:hypothetical protein
MGLRGAGLGSSEGSILGADPGFTIRPSHTQSVILLDGSLMNGEVNAYGLRSGSDLSFADVATFKGIVNFGDAKIDGKVDISGSRFEGS